MMYCNSSSTDLFSWLAKSGSCGKVLFTFPQDYSPAGKYHVFAYLPKLYTYVHRTWMSWCTCDEVKKPVLVCIVHIELALYVSFCFHCIFSNRPPSGPTMSHSMDTKMDNECTSEQSALFCMACVRSPSFALSNRWVHCHQRTRVLFMLTWYVVDCRFHHRAIKVPIWFHRAAVLNNLSWGNLNSKCLFLWPWLFSDIRAEGQYIGIIRGTVMSRLQISADAIAWSKRVTLLTFHALSA